MWEVKNKSPLKQSSSENFAEAIFVVMLSVHTSWAAVAHIRFIWFVYLSCVTRYITHKNKKNSRKSLAYLSVVGWNFVRMCREKAKEEVALPCFLLDIYHSNVNI